MNSLAAHAWPILRNDLRLAWRELHRDTRGGLRRWGPLVLLHGPILPALFAHPRAPSGGVQAIVWLFIALLMMGASMVRATILFYERSDLDLLFSSPVPYRAVLLARLGSIALIAFLSSGLLVLPLLNGLILTVSPRYAGGYVVWPLISVLTSAAGTALLLSLVRFLGVKRGRVAAQFIAGLLSLSFMLVMMLPLVLGPKRFPTVGKSIAEALRHPAYAFVDRLDRGGPLELAALVLVVAGVALLTVQIMAKLFARGVQEASTSARPRRARRPHRWSTGLDVTAWRKELRLIGRSPRLAGPVLAGSAVFLLMGTVLTQLLGVRMVSPFAFLAATQGAFLFSEIAASAEVGWDFVRASPAVGTRLRWLKIAAAATAPLLVALAACLVLAIERRGWIALLTLACSTACALGCAWVGVCTAQVAPRQDTLQTGSARKVDLRQLVLQIPIQAGAFGLGLVAFESYWWGLLFLGVMTLATLGCFTLIEPDNPEAAQT